MSEHQRSRFLRNSCPIETNCFQRYKTELCRTFQETRLCKYADKCQFAHGFEELRSLNRHPKYKTVLCRAYHCTGYCKTQTIQFDPTTSFRLGPYGHRCNFIHDQSFRIVFVDEKCFIDLDDSIKDFLHVR